MAQTTRKGGQKRPAAVQSPKRRDEARPLHRRPWFAWAAVIVVVAGVSAGIAATRGGESELKPTPIDESVLGGLQSGPAPWPPEIEHLSDRLHAIGLPALTQEGTALHIHQHLDLFVDGRRVPVPGGIGINDNAFIAPIHTHDQSGVIHVESPRQGTLTLGQFFAIWGVRFTPSCVASYCGSQENVYVNGGRFAGHRTRLALRPHQEIAIVIGKPPPHIPSSYDFPAGE